ncbi:MAG TPA: pantoate--beta-alanine ligase [Lentisphaeria bacterium]|nr:MAG: pantoate--beta-alanine ligase [Lentisphaerae bacterium GWF2_49_21]HBC86678.1 pantoate--beta-alanine ligase [Lentisphaeria bacterium]
MKVILKISEMQKYSAAMKKQGKTIALVPTMGCLHEGHLKLVDKAAACAEIVVVSIFVNPTQFGPKEDLSRYPRPVEKDLALCRKRGADAVFLPSADEMYDKDSSTWIEETMLSRGLCGKSRPGHFRGVTTIVAKLFNAALPDIAVFGKKDYQQAQVIRRMVRDLNFPVKIVLHETVRENDGLALSSRNTYLSQEERKNALSIRRSLKSAKSAILKGGKNVGLIRKSIISGISSAGGKIDYVEIVDAGNLEPAGKLSGNILIAIAAFFGRTRLIDNIEINRN